MTQLYLLKEASEITGIDVGKIFKWVIAGEIEGEINLEGAWCVTDPGMVALKRKLTRPVPLVTEADLKVKKITKGLRPVEPRKQQSKPLPPSPTKILCEARCYIRTAEDEKAYERLKEAAAISNIPAGDLVMIATRKYVKDNLTAILDQLENLAEQREKLITGLSKFE